MYVDYEVRKKEEEEEGGRQTQPHTRARGESARTSVIYLFFSLSRSQMPARFPLIFLSFVLFLFCRAGESVAGHVHSELYAAGPPEDLQS